MLQQHPSPALHSCTNSQHCPEEPYNAPEPRVLEPHTLSKLNHMVLDKDNNSLSNESLHRPIIVKRSVAKHRRPTMHQPRNPKRNEELQILRRKRPLTQTQHIAYNENPRRRAQPPALLMPNNTVPVSHHSIHTQRENSRPSPPNTPQPPQIPKRTRTLTRPRQSRAHTHNPCNRVVQFQRHTCQHDVHPRVREAVPEGVGGEGDCRLEVRDVEPGSVRGGRGEGEEDVFEEVEKQCTQRFAEEEQPGRVRRWWGCES